MKQMAMPGAGQSQPERHTAVWGQVQLAPSVLIADSYFFAISESKIFSNDSKISNNSKSEKNTSPF